MSDIDLEETNGGDDDETNGADEANGAEHDETNDADENARGVDEYLLGGDCANAYGDGGHARLSVYDETLCPYDQTRQCDGGYRFLLWYANGF
jgi:hypothetical protein